MRYDVLYNFISPVTGRLPLQEGYTFIGDKDGFTKQSSFPIDTKQDLIDLRRDLDKTNVLTRGSLWMGNAADKKEEVTSIGVLNLPELGAAIFPIPLLSVEIPIPNPTFDPLSPLAYVMSSPWLPQIFAGSTDLLNTTHETTISSTLALTQISTAQSIKRMDNAGFVVKNRTINYSWENPAYDLVTDPYLIAAMELYGLGTTYTFNEAQALDELGAGIVYNSADGILRKAISGEDYVNTFDIPIGNLVILDPLYPTAGHKLISPTSFNIRKNEPNEFGEPLPNIIDILIGFAGKFTKFAITSITPSGSLVKVDDFGELKAADPTDDILPIIIPLILPFTTRAETAAVTAEASAVDSTAKATASAASATEAAVSATAAGTSVTTAAASATAAATSVTAAGASATAAAGSATAATTFATAAEVSAVAAAVSVTAAAASATSAAASVTAAAGSATAAASSSTEAAQVVNVVKQSDLVLTTANVNFPNAQVLDSLNPGIIGVTSDGTFNAVQLVPGTNITIDSTTTPGNYVISSTGSGTVTSVGLSTFSSGIASITNTPISNNGVINIELNPKLNQIATNGTVGFLTATGGGGSTILSRRLQAGSGINIQNNDGYFGDPIISSSVSDVINITGAVNGSGNTGNIPINTTLNSTQYLANQILRLNWNTSEADLMINLTANTPAPQHAYIVSVGDGTVNFRGITAMFQPGFAGQASQSFSLFFDTYGLARQIPFSISYLGSNLVTYIKTTLDVNNNIIKNVADPANPQDAVNLRTLQSATTSFGKAVCQGTVSSYYFSNLGVGDHLKFNNIIFYNSTVGSIIMPDTTSAYSSVQNGNTASIGRITLALGFKYKLSAGLGAVSGSLPSVQWYQMSSTTNTPLGNNAIFSTTYGSSGVAIAYVDLTSSGSVDITPAASETDGDFIVIPTYLKYELRITGAINNLDNIDTPPWFTVETL